METEIKSTKKKRSIKKTLLWIVAGFTVAVSIAAFFLYNNFNRLLSDALIKSFNSNIVSDVYELKFERLGVNFLLGNIDVYNVEMKPREKPLHNYPYINTSFQLKTGKILLKNVEILTLLKSNILKLERVEIAEPDIQLLISDKIPTIFPFKDSTLVATPAQTGSELSIESFLLKEFDIVNAAFHVTNTARKREFNVKNFNFSLRDLVIAQLPGKDVMSYKHVDFSIGEATGSLQKEPLKYVHFKDYTIAIDSLEIKKSVDTMIFHFTDFTAGVDSLDVQTEDNIFHLTLASFDLSYKNRSIKLQGLSFKPNISEAAMQAKFKYQHTQFSSTIGTLQLKGLNFDSLIYGGKIFIDQVSLDKVTAAIFKDKTKPFDKTHFPVYLGQTIKAIPIPLLIKDVKATNVNLVNRERNPDGSYAKANINRATLEVKNITNFSSHQMLVMKADAYVENKAHFNLVLNFNYLQPQFSFDGAIKQFNLPDLNPLIEAYTPASVKKGTVDEMTFSGNVYRTNSTGTMKFLYHDLAIDLELEKKAKWKSTVLSFGANALLPGANPASAAKPPRIVEFHAERDMNKSFVNILIKSILAGLKETMIMSKENRKDYREAKKDAKKEAKVAKKKAKKERKNK